jgi:hypothetical protein
VTTPPAAVLACLPLVCSIGGGIVSHAASGVADSVLGALGRWVADGAAWVATHVIAELEAPTVPKLGKRWFADEVGAMTRIAVLVMAPMLGAATLGAVVRQDMRRLTRIYAVGLPVAVLAEVVVIAMAQLALKVVQALCDLIAPGKGSYAQYADIGSSTAFHGAPVFVQFLLGGVVALAAIVLWLELVLRASVLYILVFFLPLALAAFIWPATSHVTKRFIEVIVAVIGSKFVIVATLTLGAAALGPKAEGADTTITGVGILLLAAFAPFAVLRLVPIVEAAAVTHLEGMSRRPAQQAVAGGAAVAGTAGRVGTFALGAGGGGQDGGVTTDAVAETGVGTHAGSWSPDAAGAGVGGATGASGGVGGATTESSDAITGSDYSDAFTSTSASSTTQTSAYDTSAFATGTSAASPGGGPSAGGPAGVPTGGVPTGGAGAGTGAGGDPGGGSVSGTGTVGGASFGSVSGAGAGSGGTWGAAVPATGIRSPVPALAGSAGGGAPPAPGPSDRPPSPGAVPSAVVVPHGLPVPPLPPAGSAGPGPDPDGWSDDA